MPEKQYKIVFLTQDYFRDNVNYEEMLDHLNTTKQSKRQYLFVEIKYKDNNILIPLRSHLPKNKHIGDIGYPIPSSEKPNAGLDFRKIIIVNDENYIENPKFPKIPKSQQHIIQQNYLTIENKAIQYIKGYIKSSLKNRHRRDKKYRFSTLHNFHQELGIISTLKIETDHAEQVAATME